jgi:exopolyphosphatase/guanosine-5'-triphosphate,3'-diphosphate pyrophosphatase
MERFASIDIGTNTILLLIAELHYNRLKPVFEKETIVRLGEGLQKNGMISPEAMDRGLKTLKRYVQQCKKMNVKNIFAVGTSVLREAKNSKVFLKVVREKLNLSIQIISGRKEAYLSFISVSKEIKEFKNPIMVIDVGGGSTEFIIGKNHQLIKWVSLPIGSVRLTECFIQSDPVKIEECQKMERKIKSSLKKVPKKPHPSLIFAVGGTATTLASVGLGLKKFNPKKIHHFPLTKDIIRSQLEIYKSLTIKERKKIPGLPPSRADVILAGGTILYLAMEELKCQSVIVSCHGVRYGVLYEKLKNKLTI